MYLCIKPTFLALALCLALVAAPLRAAPLDVVASFSILADLARQVGGDRVHVVSMVGPDEDAHGFQTRPSDARVIRDADLVIANGLGFDSWIERLAQSAGYGGELVIASAGIAPIEEVHGHAHQHDNHDHGALDPHAWQDVRNVQRYVANIAAALARADPDGAAHYRGNAERYTDELRALDDEIRSTMSALSAANRKVVTSHDAFGYFGKAYGIRFVAAAGLSSHSEPSAAGIARLIRQLRRENIPVVFLENISDTRMIERIGKEAGARVGSTLYSDALSGPDGPAPTYVEMMRFNVNALMEGLQSAER
jgi:zinc/manganese transport system substrate-binding protein